MLRRSFVATPLLAAPFAAAHADKQVFAYGDGIPHTPAEYAGLLESLTKSSTLVADDYSRGGVVEQLEQRMAAILGKEYAVWLPTGTLANHLAIRLLAGDQRRVLMQAESHLFNDCGDCAQTLSGLHLVPLASGHATFTLDQAKAALLDSTTGRVVTPIGAMQIESPVRRRRGEVFDFAEMQRISSWARQKKIGMHLDGARLFIEAAYTKRSVKDYARLFDTVYISQYKYFNAASGAILAGPKALLENVFHTRRMFGGGLAQAWPYAAVALHYLDGFEQRMQLAVENSERLFANLASNPRLSLERIPNGTNIARLKLQSGSAEAFMKQLAMSGIFLRPAVEGRFNLQVNETWGRVTTDFLSDAFHKASRQA